MLVTYLKMKILTIPDCVFGGDRDECLSLVQGILNKNKEKMAMRSYGYIFFGPEELGMCCCPYPV